VQVARRPCRECESENEENNVTETGKEQVSKNWKKSL
jgi:hypothetical protein